MLDAPQFGGRIEASFCDPKSATRPFEQRQPLRGTEQHQNADQSYLEERVGLSELANRAAEPFERQDAREKRQLLDWLLSNCSWKHGASRRRRKAWCDRLADRKTARATHGGGFLVALRRKLQAGVSIAAGIAHSLNVVAWYTKVAPRRGHTRRHPLQNLLIWASTPFLWLYLMVRAVLTAIFVLFNPPAAVRPKRRR